LIRNLPLDERPRERLAEKGANFLSSIELIAILLGSGTRNRSALVLASDLLGRFGGLDELSTATLQELLTVKGVGMAKALTLQATFALWKRLRPPQSEGRVIIDGAQKAFAQIYPMVADEKAEVVCILLRDTKRGLLHKEIISRGTINQVLMHPREVFSSAIRHLSHSLIIAHNHPTGECTPSGSDLEITHTLRAAGSLVGIPLVDHLIIGKGAYFSFSEEGLLESSY
jgi:DNA repair protein RadC